jgi:hypothetical protein
MKWIPHLSIALIVVGAAFTLFIVAQIPGEVFFSGDGALKTLHAKQHLERGFSVALELQEESWVRRLWDDGLYPFKPPFVYEEQGRFIVGFPFLFPLLTAPLYRAAGYHGLYLLPLASLWLLWIFFRSHCRRIGLESSSALIGLALLVLASPLTLYGAIYWEHVPAALLAFFGLEFMAGLCAGRSPGAHPSLCGLLAGLAVWLRAEYLVLLPIFFVLAFLSAKWHPQGVKRAGLFLSGGAISLAGFFAANIALYGHPLGAHSRQVLETISLQGRLVSSFGFLGKMGLGLVVDYPAALAALVAIPFMLLYRGEEQLSRYGRALAISGLLFFLIVPFIVPNAGGKQLGPRYILFLAPVLALLLPVALQLLKGIGKRRLMMLARLVIAAAVLAGAYQNLYVRAGQLIKDYRERVWPALEVVRQHPARYVVVPNQWTAQELEVTFADKIYFHAAAIEDGVRLAEALAERGVYRFLAVLHFEDSTPSQIAVAAPSPIERLEFSSLGLYGSFYILEATSIPRKGSVRELTPF